MVINIHEPHDIGKTSVKSTGDYTVKCKYKKTDISLENFTGFLL